VRHCEEVLAPVLLRGATTRPLKPKSWRLGGRWRWWSRQRRQPPLHWAASPAAATTSATGSPANGGDHLSTDDSGHLCTGGLPTTTDASARAERSSPLPSCGVRTRPSKNVAATSTAYDVLYNPQGGVGAAWPAAQGTLRMRRTCSRRNRRPCGGWTATPHLAAGGSVGGGTKAIQAKEPDTRQLTVPTAGRPRVSEVCLLRKAGEHPSPPNAGGRSGSPAHAEGRTPTRLAFHPSEDDEHP
jgi:hypothetical protein